MLERKATSDTAAYRVHRAGRERGSDSLLATQEAWLEAWQRSPRPAPERTVQPRVLRIDNAVDSDGLAEGGCLLLLAWLNGCAEAASLVQALASGDAEARTAAQRQLRERLAAAERGTGSAGDAPAAMVELRWGAHPVTTLPIDAAVGFALVRVPYHGGRLDVRGFAADLFLDDAPAVETAVLLRPPMLSPVEEATRRLLHPRTGRPLFRPEPISFIGKIKHIAEKGVHVAEHGARDIAKVGEEVGKGVAHVVVGQNKVAMQQEGEGHQGVGPGAEDGAGPGDDAGAGDDAAADAADATEAATAVGGVAISTTVAGAGRPRRPVRPAPEADVETLLAYRNRVLTRR